MRAISPFESTKNCFLADGQSALVTTSFRLRERDRLFGSGREDVSGCSLTWKAPSSAPAWRARSKMSSGPFGGPPFTTCVVRCDISVASVASLLRLVSCGLGSCRTTSFGSHRLGAGRYACDVQLHQRRGH